MTTIEIVKNHLGISEPNLIFVYGSEIYGTKTPDSDIDCMVVGVEDNEFTIDAHNIDVHCISENTFTERLKAHDIQVLEGISLFQHSALAQYIEGETIQYDIDKSALRSSISKICSNSFVKAKKKLLVPKDYDRYVSMKSLFHSLRIYEFGTQIAKHGYVVNFQSCNQLFAEIQQDYASVRDDAELLAIILTKFKPLFNQYASAFKTVCPK